MKVTHSMRAALFLLPLVSLHAQTVCPPTPAYSTCELTFEVADGELKGDGKLYAEVRSPRHKTYLMPAFASAPGKMTIRVAPTEPGTWDYRVTSSLARYSGKTGSFESTESGHPGFVVAANLRHWATGDDRQPHLWLGAAGGDPETLAAAHYNHVRMALDTNDYDGAEKKIRAYNEKRITVDLVLPSLPVIWQERERALRYLVGRFAAFNITWQLTGDRKQMKETGLALKKMDPYGHPRSAVTADTSAPLLADGWPDHILYSTVDDQLGAIEHQLYPRPKVSLALVEGKDPAQFRHSLWNMFFNGQYPSVTTRTEAGAKAVAGWFELASHTRHWELEPYFDVDGARALALEGVEYVVYIEKPGPPVELLVEKHSYDVYWLNPITGEYVKDKKDWKGEKYIAEAPDKSHDWVLHLSRDGRKEGMLKSYKFESRMPMVQEIDPADKTLPFELAAPEGDEISMARPPKFAARIKRQTRATRTMMYLWTGEVVTTGEGARVLGSGAEGTLRVPPGMAPSYPAVFNLRVVGMNANGKLYSIDKVYRLTP